MLLQMKIHAIKASRRKKPAGGRKLEQVQNLLIVGVRVCSFTPSVLKFVDMKEHVNILQRHSEFQAKETNTDLNPPHYVHCLDSKSNCYRVEFVFCCQDNHPTAGSHQRV